MALTQRRTLRFLIPTELSDIQEGGLNKRAIIPLYISPQDLNIQERKIIKDSLTKGGYMVQYWGEELPVIQASGTTGSGGIEAVEILRSVYRNEITQFKKLLLQRTAEYSEEVSAQISDTSSISAIAGFAAAADELLDGIFTSNTDGIISTIDAVSQAFKGLSQTQSKQVELIPSLAAFAVSVDLYFQGVKYRGYFTDFSVRETASSPGLFDYSFNFKVIRRYGNRKNFMPWHRKPTDASGVATQASLPLEGPRPEELSLPYGEDVVVPAEQVISTFQATQDGEADTNNVGVSRRRKARG